MKKYKVKEIFGPTIQGEGSKAGTVVMFLRLSGCNRWSGRPEDKAESICNFCDTDFLGGTMMSAQEILKQLRAISNDVREVVISGGEPMLQLDVDLARTLWMNDYKIHLETNGSIEIPLELYTYMSHVTVSPKQHWVHTKQRFATDLKLLYPWVDHGVSDEGFKEFKAVNRFIQAVWGIPGAVEKVLQTPGYRLSVQLHKVLGVQ